MTTITLSDQASFANFFRQFAAGDIKKDDVIKFKLPETAEEKPFLQIEGDGYNGTINTLMMDILQIHQTNIHKLYSLVAYGEVKKLKPSEVEALRIVFRVNAGSSIITIENGEKIIEFIILALVDPTQLGTLVVGLILLFANFWLDYYFANRDSKERQKDRDFTAEERQKDRDFTAEERQKDRDFTAEQKQKDRDLILKAIKESTVSKEIIDGEKKTLDAVKKLARQTTVVKYLGHPISPVAEEKEYSQKQLNGKYKILSFTAVNNNYFRVRVKNITTGYSFNVRLNAITSKKDMQSEISNAVPSRKELYLNIDARFAGNKLDRARIVSIGEKITPSYQTTND